MTTLELDAQYERMTPAEIALMLERDPKWELPKCCTRRIARMNQAWAIMLNGAKTSPRPGLLSVEMLERDGFSLREIVKYQNYFGKAGG